MKRPEFFTEIKGHDWLVEYFSSNIKEDTLHHFLILEGGEGLGKTSFADVIALSLVYGLQQSEKRHEAYEQVVVTGESNDFIKRFKCSIDGGKDVARMIKDEMNTAMLLGGKKVIICDECHGLTEQAQDVFLSETEFIDDKVYVIMLTTEINKLKASLQSRAVPIHLNTLKKNDMISVLKDEVTEKGLIIQHEDSILSMIADWAGCKPRTGLNILNAFSNGSTVSANSIRELIGFMDITDVLPLLASLSGSMTFGLSYISEMKVNNSLIDLVIECVCVKNGQASYKLRMTDIGEVKRQLADVTSDQLVTFLHGLTKHTRLTKSNIIHAYISAHSSFGVLTQSDTSYTKSTEDLQRADSVMALEEKPHSKAPTLDDLMLGSSIIG